MLFSNDFYLIVPEIYLFISIISLIWLSVVYTTELITVGRLLAIQIGVISLSILVLTFLLYFNIINIDYYIFGTSFLSNKLNKFFLFLVLIGTMVIITLTFNYIKRNSLKLSEFFLLILLILFGLIILTFSNDFITMYIGIELQSLGLYILAALKQNSIYATEAGLKYFILGSVASCLLILGISIIYSFVGINTFAELAIFYNIDIFSGDIYYGSLLGFLLVLVSLLFKVGSAPFHIWLPDVYEGVATIITAFFALVPKLVIFNLFIKIFLIIQSSFIEEFRFIIFISSLLSLLIGNVGALYQVTLKRLLSYSAIGNTGFILLGFVINNIYGLVSVIFYLLIYYSLIISVFAIILQIQKKEDGTILKYISNLGYVYINNKALGICLLITFFSFAGIPPLSGFFSKLFLFIAALNQNNVGLVIIICIYSMISCVYCLKVIRSIMFVKDKKKHYLLINISSSSSYLIVISVLFQLLFVVIGEDLLALCYNLIIDLMY